MFNNNKSAVEEGFPVSENGRSWVFGSNLIKYLDGSFELVFLPDYLGRNLRDNSKGSIRLQTKDGVDFLFTISDVRHDRFKQLAKLFEGEARCVFHKKVEELAKCKGNCHTAGHYECWEDNCNCICHVARRVLGISFPKSYIPVPRE